MEHRLLGQTSLKVARLSLGCVTFGREIDEAASIAVLDHALAAGLVLLDTAEAYGGGQSRAARANSLGHPDAREVSDEHHSSEMIIGRWLSAQPSRRDRVILQTKVTPPLTRHRILTSLEESLRRLRTDHLDAFLLHAFDPKNPLEESLAALDDAVRAGKTRFVGCSNFTSANLTQALDLAVRTGLPRLDVAQFNYNLAVRDAESSLLPLCRDRRVGVQTYSPLGAGFLTGKYDPATRTAAPGSRFDIVPGHADVYFHPEKFAAAERLQRLARVTGVPAPRLAVAWVLNHPDVDTVLIGARTPGHVDNALAAAELSFRPEWRGELIA